MKFLVLGANEIGYAAVFDLIRTEGTEQVIWADSDAKKLNSYDAKIIDDKVVACCIDPNDLSILGELFNKVDVSIGCLGSAANLEMLNRSLAAGKPFVDTSLILGTAERIYALDSMAVEQNTVILPGCSLVPGVVSLLASAAAASLDPVYEISIAAGCLPVYATNGFSLNLATMPEELINLCTNDVKTIVNGSVMTLPPLPEPQSIKFPQPIGELETIPVAASLDTLAASFKGNIQQLSFTMVARPGLRNHLSLLSNLGFMDKEAVKINNIIIEPKAVFNHLLNTKISKQEPDMILIRVTAIGLNDSKPLEVVFEAIDHMDHANELSALARLNGFTGSIAATMIAKGIINEPGVKPLHEVAPHKLFIEELASRGIRLSMTTHVPGE